MPKRKKRLKKGIESLKEQIELHKEKRRQALEEGKLELANYYEGEIEDLTGAKERKEDQFEKS